MVKQVFLAVLFSVAGIVLIFSFFSWHEIPTDFTIPYPSFLVLGFGVLVVAWSIDAIRVFLTTRAWGKKIGIGDAYNTVLSAYFFGGITPANAGGSVAEIYVLNRAGLTWGEATSLTAICGILYQMALVIMYFVLFLGSPAQIVVRSRLLSLIYSFFIVYAIAMAALFVCIQWPNPILRITGKVLDWLERRFPRFDLSRQKTLGWIENFLGEFREGFAILFHRKPLYLFLNLGMHTVYFLCLFSVAQFVILALGITPSFSTVVRLQIPVFFTFGVVPTPGASGGVEIALTSTFALLLGGGRVGTFVFYWRIITYYITLVIGGIAFFRTLEK